MISSIEVYVKCKITCPEPFLNCYGVRFKGSEKFYPILKGEFFVSESTLIKKTNQSGFISGCLIEKGEKESIVIISDAEQGGIFSHISNEEIIFDKNSLKI